MSGSTRFRCLSFGDVDGELWGAAIDLGTPALALGTGSARTSLAGPGELQWSADGPRWTLTGEGLLLEVDPGGEEFAPPPAPASEVTGLEELCRVRGQVAVDGGERAVDCVGTRSVVDGVDSGKLESLRAVSGWFGDEEAFTLVSFRARRGHGHESDLVAATLFDPDGWRPVSDPRLSTTYAASGAPLRTTLELWVGDGENELARRAAGEASGPEAVGEADGLRLRVSPLRCHSRGLDGSGVYVLATL